MDARRIPFTEDDEHKISSAATWGSVVALTTIGTQIISLLIMLTREGVSGAAIEGNFVGLVTVAFTLIVNVWLLQASAAFQKVARTDEADQAYLLQGFRKLRVYFMVQVLTIVVVIAIAVVMAMIAM